MLYGVNICVHQLGRVCRWEIVNVDRSQGFIHLAYEGRAHYNSIRKEFDGGDEPVIPFSWQEAEAEMNEYKQRMAAMPSCVVFSIGFYQQRRRFNGEGCWGVSEAISGVLYHKRSRWKT